MAYPHQQPPAPPVITPSQYLVRDVLEVLRERGVESRATPQEIKEIAVGVRDIRTVLL
jgi:hypothetical protein